MHVPTTSKTLLRDLGADARSPRWAEFISRYRPMMESFLAARYPSLAPDADDLVQETLVALLRALPDYRYVPGEQGSFHNYLTGILRNKAASLLRRREAEAARDAWAAAESAAPPALADEVAAERDEDAWRDAVLQIALRQLLATSRSRSAPNRSSSASPWRAKTPPPSRRPSASNETPSTR